MSPNEEGGVVHTALNYSATGEAGRSSLPAEKKTRDFQPRS